MIRLTHRRCRHESEDLADAALRQTERAEDLLAKTESLESELRDTEHDLEVAAGRVSALVDQLTQVLEDAHESGMLYRTWALLDRTMGANDDGDHLYAALRNARVSDLGRAQVVYSQEWPSLYGVCQGCEADEDLVVVRHLDAPGRERMLCEACEHHWPMPAHLRSDLERLVPWPGPHDPIRLLPQHLLAALDAAFPTAEEHRITTDPAVAA